jgi:hypothetical protein
MHIYTIFFSHKYFSKSQKGIENWTFLKMSKNRITQKFPKNVKKSQCDLNAHNYFFCIKKM